MLDDLVGKKVLIAVSGGPDSMALLNMCVTLNIKCVVAHVNYQKRDSAIRDELIVKNYCKSHDILMYTLYPKYESGNFQKWARDVRYEFFNQIVTNRKLYCTLVAHHLDDLIETFLIQQKRCTIPSFYGIKKETTIKGVLIIRELLNFTKDDLVKYCDNQCVEYGIDESNLSNDYTRNKIRHEIVEKMTHDEKNEMLLDIKMRNIELKISEELIKQLLNDDLKIDYNIYSKLSEFERAYYIRTIFYKVSGKRFSMKRCLDLDRQLKTNRNVEINVLDYVKLSKMYNIVAISKTKEVLYSYVLNEVEFISNKYFKLTDKGTTIESLTLSSNDFPITIRNAQNNDSIKLRFGTKKINRFFIDRKIPYELRKSWPVVLNCAGEIIFIPEIGCDLKHYSNNPNCFVVKW